MILTCPNCATRYFLHDVLIGREGRVVKCTHCATVWRAEAQPDEPLALTPAAADDALAHTPPEPEAKPEADGLAALPADKLSQTFRARAQVQQKVREAAATGAIWAGVTAGLVLLIALAAVFRADVVRLWPKTASAYAAVGLPVNTTGLIIEQVQAAPATVAGHAAVAVSGVMRNIEDRAVSAPPLRVSLLAKGGRPLARLIDDGPAPLILPGETRHFTVNMVDPPSGSSDVEVTFALEAAAARSAAKTAAAPKLRGPAAPPPIAPPHPIDTRPLAPGPLVSAQSGAPLGNAPLANVKDAKPLPPGSPYALPAAKP